MTADDRRQADGSESIDSAGASRRTYLKTAATVAIAAGGMGTATGSGVADTDTIQELDFRYGTPSVSDAPQNEDEVLFNVHGYTGSSFSVSQAREFQQTARSQGWTETVAAVTWDDSGLPSSAESSARETGVRLAGFIESYLDANPDTAIRVLGHSMGGFVTMEMTAALGTYQVENADMIGSYEQVDAPCEGNFFDSISSNVSGMYNYHSSNDSIARLGQDGAQCGSGGWWSDSSDADTPSNYHDVDVTASVGGHTDYKSSTGCVQQIIDNHEPAIDRGGGGGGDDGDDDDGWWS